MSRGLKMQLTLKDKIYFISISAIVAFLAYDHFSSRSFPQETTDNKVFYRGGYEKEIYDKVGIDPPYPQPLAGVISEPQNFYDIMVITSGYLRLHSPDAGRLYLNKDDAENFIYLNAILVSDLSKSLDYSLSDFDNRYVTIVGVIYNLEEFPAMKKIDGLWDLEKRARRKVPN